jgi:hypothetical protein
MDVNNVSGAAIGAAIEVHKSLGPPAIGFAFRRGGRVVSQRLLIYMGIPHA